MKIYSASSQGKPKQNTNKSQGKQNPCVAFPSLRPAAELLRSLARGCATLGLGKLQPKLISTRFEAFFGTAAALLEAASLRAPALLGMPATCMAWKIR